jgi:hypothetical protein
LAEFEHYVFSLLANEALNILWVGDSEGDIFQYVLGPKNVWKLQTKYSKYTDREIRSIRSLSRFGNLLFAGDNSSDVFVINTADKKILPGRIYTAIYHTNSLQICKVSPSKTYLTVTGKLSNYSRNKTDLFDISKFQQRPFVEKIFSNPESHLNSIYNQFNDNSTTKGLHISNSNSKQNNLS